MPTGEWEVINGPWSMAAKETVYVFVQRPGDPGTKREMAWATHEKITVRGGSVSRPRPDLDDVARIEALRAELRRRRSEVKRLEKDNCELEKRQRLPVRLSSP